MNSREQRKRDRIDLLKRIIQKEEWNDDKLVSMLIVNHAISKRVALEEINAVRIFLENE